MNRISLSEKDLDQVDWLFDQFHAEYTPFFQVGTKNVAKAAKDYLQGQLFTKQEHNMVQYCTEVEESEYEAMPHLISNSPWDHDK